MSNITKEMKIGSAVGIVLYKYPEVQPLHKSRILYFKDNHVKVAEFFVSWENSVNGELVGFNSRNPYPPKKLDIDEEGEWFLTFDLDGDQPKEFWWLYVRDLPFKAQFIKGV